MKKNSFNNRANGSKAKPPQRTAHKTAHKPAQKPQHSTQKFDGAHRVKTEKLQYPKSWRQITGTHAILELLNTRPKTVETVLLQANWRSSSDLRELADIVQAKKIKVEEKSENQLFEISKSHQGAVAFSSETLEFGYQDFEWGDNGMVVALDGVEDTQNLGAVLRTSWLMGVQGIIIPEDRAVGLTATVHKVASGGAEHVPIHRTNQFSAPFETLKKAGFWVFGLSHKANKTIYDLNMPEKVVWVLGAEDKGLRGPTEKACDELVSIPQTSPSASYNVSVSAALAMAETKRQWSQKK